MPGVSDLYGAYQVEFDTTMLSGMTTQSINTGSQVSNEITSGNVYAEFLALTGQQPVAAFSTMQIARALDNVPILGTSIAGLGAGLKFYLRKHEEGATRTAGSAHNKYTITEGIIVPTSLTVDHQGDASISYDIVITYDGSNSPIVLTVNQALPGSQLDDQRFTLGKVVLESITFDHLKQMTINFGVSAVSEGADSEIWDRYASIRSVLPSLTLSGIDPDWFADAKVPLLGLAVTHANTAFYLRKRANGNSFVADVTAEHIKFTAAGLATIDDAVQVSGQDPSGLTLNMPLKFDGTNVPLTVDTTSAIT